MLTVPEFLLTWDPLVVSAASSGGMPRRLCTGGEDCANGACTEPSLTKGGHLEKAGMGGIDSVVLMRAQQLKQMSKGRGFAIHSRYPCGRMICRCVDLSCSLMRIVLGAVAPEFFFPPKLLWEPQPPRTHHRIVIYLHTTRLNPRFLAVSPVRLPK